jgi:predicted MFS family arabinose efflux permease
MIYERDAAEADGVACFISRGAFALVASEFMPVSWLTSLAIDLPTTTRAKQGQAIAVAGAFAVLTSLFISSIATRIDRKTPLQLFCSLRFLWDYEPCGAAIDCLREQT